MNLVASQTAAHTHRERVRHAAPRQSAWRTEPIDVLLTTACVECDRSPREGEPWMNTWGCAQIPVLHYSEADDPPPRCPRCERRLRQGRP